jgi:hypothetical protein
MNKEVKKSLVKAIGYNLLAGLAGMAPFLFIRSNDTVTWGFLLIGIAVISLLVQLVVAIVYINHPEKKETGQGMLISVGIFFLIGLAVCSPVLM